MLFAAITLPIIAEILSLGARIFSTCRSSQKTITCLSNSTVGSLEELVECFDHYTVPPEHYSQENYDAAQPNPTELIAWADAISTLLVVDGNCTTTVVPAPLVGLFAISTFTDSQNSYCVLSELYAGDSGYKKGWGLMVVPASHSPALRNIHISAPHPVYDLNTLQQAAALFKLTNARSLLVTGRTRTSYKVPTECVVSRGLYYKTDPTHDDNEPFHFASKTILAWQHARGGCSATTCAFVQMHGKAESTCPLDTMFLSSGLGHSASSVSWYTDSVDRPIKRLTTHLRQAFPEWNISLPSDSSCSLTAMGNVFGRFVNGVSESNVCTDDAVPELATGEFIHIEQAAISRQADTYVAWAQALMESFPSIESSPA